VDRRELETYVIAAASAVLGLRSVPAIGDPRQEEIVDAFDDLFNDPLPLDRADYARLRESIAAAVCVNALVRRGIPITYEWLERIGQVIAARVGANAPGGHDHPSIDGCDASSDPGFSESP
jgi:hypothetical protein